MKNNRNCKFGFTLIELLVVVLIIGILASIALPQYQKAVDKAKFTRYQVLVKSLGDARRRLFLATGEWAHRFDELDVELPGEVQSIISLPNNSVGQVATFDWGYCYIIEPKPGWSDADVFCGGYDLVGYVHTLRLADDDEEILEAYCVSSKDNSRGQKLCNSFGALSTWGCFFGPDARAVCQAKAARL